MDDDPDKIANVALHQRSELMDTVQRLTEALTDIEELVESDVDVTRHGQPNLAMRVYTVVRHALGKTP
jgi:hypothetical protein